MIKKLRNREAAQLSRDKKKAQFNILSGMVHGLRKENVYLREEIETLRANQEQLIAENERLREQLSTESSIPKSVVTEFCTSATPSAEGQTESNILFDALLSDSVPITDHSILHDLKLPDDDDDMDWLDNNVSKRLEKIADELLGESFLNECSLDEMVGSTSEVMESGQNINLPNADINDDNSIFMLNTDTDKITSTVKIPTEEMQFSVPNIDQSKIEEHSEDKSNSLERFIIVEEAVEEVTTTYDEHILEICQEDDIDTEQYDDIGYESLSSPEYDYRTHYSTPLILTDLLS
ncbi:X-box-binding protein 1 [Aphis craccivora]|uniref:X-box-binding protein 1 n=1 Tax=Aphis craccivora TaxID=307492 RepID=A0A6G0Z4E6_APHCR|nr:X-box-binding protein 1 [Aphis craccivora]